MIKNMDIIVQFAVLWGQKVGSALFPEEIKMAKELKQYDSTELLEMFCGWMVDYCAGDEEDTVSFFEEKLANLFCV